MSKRDSKAPLDPEFPLDPSTGMPVPPEGMFWRVVSAGSESLHVQLRQPYRWRKSLSDCIRSMTVYTHGWFQTGPDANNDQEYLQVDQEWLEHRIRVRAIDILRERRKSYEDYRAKQVVLGDYPPKKLGG